MLRLGLLYGGRSNEHAVSLCSAASVFSALNKNKYNIIPIGIDKDGKWYVQDNPEIIIDKDFGEILIIKKTGLCLINHFENNNKLCLYNIKGDKNVEVDVVFPIVHGISGEDGKLQGLLELSMTPFVGADILGSVIGMDKDISKRLLNEKNIPIVPWITVRKGDWELDSDNIISKALKELGLPLFIKPSNSGSSVGIIMVKEKEKIHQSIEFSFKFDNKILIEKGIKCREIECAVLGNNNIQVSIPGEIVPQHEYYSYEAKYLDPDGAKLRIPAKINSDISDKIRQTASDAYKILNCSGLARVDFFLDIDSNNFYLNEINTIPGFTKISMYPKLWEGSGLEYTDLLDKLIELAIDKHSEKLKIMID